MIWNSHSTTLKDQSITNRHFKFQHNFKWLWKDLVVLVWIILRSDTVMWIVMIIFFLSNMNCNGNRRGKTSMILLWLTPDDFSRQGENSRSERTNLYLAYV